MHAKHRRTLVAEGKLVSSSSTTFLLSSSRFASLSALSLSAEAASFAFAAFFSLISTVFFALFSAEVPKAVYSSSAFLRTITTVEGPPFVSAATGVRRGEVGVPSPVLSEPDSSQIYSVVAAAVGAGDSDITGIDRGVDICDRICEICGTGVEEEWESRVESISRVQLAISDLALLGHNSNQHTGRAELRP